MSRHRTSTCFSGRRRSDSGTGLERTGIVPPSILCSVRRRAFLDPVRSASFSPGTLMMARPACARSVEPEGLRLSSRRAMRSFLECRTRPSRWRLWTTSFLLRLWVLCSSSSHARKSPATVAILRLRIPEVDERAASHGDKDAEARRHDGPPSGFVRPDCGGTLFRLTGGGLERFRCRVGHGYSLESLNDAQSESVEEALWVSLRTLEEHGDFLRRAAARARARGLEHAARAFEDRMAAAGEHAEIIRKSPCEADDGRR
jgi:hypothetical protein